MYDHLVLGQPGADATQTYSAPDHKAPLHNSMNAGWAILEGFPKRRTEWSDWPHNWSVGGWYLPLAERRRIDEGSNVHWSVKARSDADPSYRPPNLPPWGKLKLIGKPPAPAA